MSWFNSGFANLAKTALTQAQKTIDRALDIQDPNEDEKKVGKEKDSTKVKDDAENFFAAFGLEKASGNQSTAPKVPKLEIDMVPESLWGSFTGSFFETAKRNAERLENRQCDHVERTSTSSQPSVSSEQLIIVTQPTIEIETTAEKTSADREDEDAETPKLKSSAESILSFDKNYFDSLDKSTDSTETIKQDPEEILEAESMAKSHDNEFSSIQSCDDNELHSIQLCDVTVRDNELHPIQLCDTTVNDSELNLLKSCGEIAIQTCDTTTSHTVSSSDVTVTEPTKYDKEKKINTALRENEDVRDVETKSTDSVASYDSSTGSFVKCMMDDSVCEREIRRSHSPHSTTSSDKSDMVKLDCEHTSGHTSGDELETTTSSDVEIISVSSPNGDGADKMSVSPMKRVWKGPPPFRRSDRAESPASDSSSVRDCPMSKHLLSEFGNYSRSNSSRKVSRKAEEMASVEGISAGTDKLTKKVIELTEILNARESKLLEVSRENVILQDTNAVIRRQLKQSEEAHAADTKDVTVLTEELSQRLATMERNLQQALTEKESLKTELHLNKQEVANRLCAKEVEETIKEKDTQIKELMQEGEKLSKQHLQQSNIIKKLRAKEKENDTLIKGQKQKLEDQGIEIERVRKSLAAKEEIERKQIDAIRQLTNTVQKQEKEISSLKVELTDANSKIKSMQTTLDNSNKELTEFRKSLIERDSQVQEATLSAEMAAKDELRSALEKAQRDARLTQEGLIMQIEDLRLSLSRTEQQANRKEDALRQEISDLQQRLQEAEVRNQELTQNVSAATRPLLRQIENLQATFNSQVASWEKLESNLTDRLNKSQSHLSIAVEKEKAATEKYRELSNSLSALEAQNSVLRDEKTRLQLQLETQQTKLGLLENWKSKETMEKEVLKHSFSDEIGSLKKAKKDLEHQLEIERTVVEAEKRKSALLQEQLKEKERRLSHAPETSIRTTPSPTPSLSRFSSVSESFNPWLHEDTLDQSIIMSNSTNGNKFNLYEALRHNGATSLLENLQSQLKMREGEIIQLQSEISQLERVRESMAIEMVQLATNNEELDEELKKLQEQKANFQDMQQKYNALLQMYGEKVEEADELRLDLIDVKEMYKAQISELLKKT